MENIELGRASIDEEVMLSSDVETEESTDTEIPTSIDTAQPEAGKSSLTELIDEERSDKAKIENDALSNMRNQLEEETSYSDPYPVCNIDSFTQAYDIAVKSRTGKVKFNIRQALTGNRKTNSIMLRSGKHLATNTKNNTEIGSSANADETGERNSQPILLDDPDPKPSRKNRKSTAEKIRKRL
ncbi:hypothetical protein F2Q70_00039106 [Brassica cretica]|uniref:Uncharacterized protein n=1 Tax=Brassica cretica TaxID=69181 RepID=A0A8S9K3L9_BRACR|nr:hypothetical protein F2Q70_00039106 [Brassica cretica]